MKQGFYLSPCGEEIVKIDTVYRSGSHSIIEQRVSVDPVLVESHYLPNRILLKMVSCWHYLGE